jgi:chromatin remodeling complex protein RSC6
MVKKTATTTTATDTPAKTTAPVKKTVSKKKATIVTETPVEVIEVKATNAVVADAPKEKAPEIDIEQSISDDFGAFMSKMQGISSQFSALRNEFRALEKKAMRELKNARKKSAQRQRKSGNRSPSGFVKPTLITDELATFLGKDLGSEMARTEVTREINKYIRAHQLQDPENGRKINPDAKLEKLLKIPKGEVLTYFNLQRYMSPHFPKPPAVVAALKAAAEAKAAVEAATAAAAASS